MYMWPNKVLYQANFAPLAADAQFTHTLAGLEQDVILRQNPASPASYGLDPQTTRLEVWTEFLNPPVPQRSSRVIKPAAIPAGGGLETDLVDEQIDFGSMMMVSGNALAVGAATNTVAPVVKRWLESGGRTFLIEAVEYPAISNALAALPDAAPAAGGEMPSRTAALGRPFPAWATRAQAASGTGGKPVELAGAPAKAGVVIDYLLVEYTNNFTFQGDTTYLVSAPVFLARTNTIEGGAVIKYGTQGKVHLVGNVQCQTAPYRPAIFTSMNDDSVGVRLPPAAQSVPLYYAQPALALEGVNPLNHLRFRNAQTAVSFLGGGGYGLAHAQVVRCQTGFRTLAAEVTLRNVLLDGVGIVCGGTESTVAGEHLTVDAANWLNGGPSVTLNLTNSLLAGVTNAGPVNASTAVVVSPSGANVFAVAGAGAHYLPADSPLRHLGVTAIDPDLARDLRRLTTDAPLLVTDDPGGASLFEPRVFPDTGTPDLGYHYEPLDFLWSAVRVSQPMTWQNGVTMGVLGSDGPEFSGDAGLLSQGSVQAPNRLTRAAAVQERAVSVGAPGSLSGWLRVAAGSRAAFQWRFTEVSDLADSWERRALVGGGGLGAMSATSCRFENSLLTVAADGANLALTNNIFRNAHLTLGGTGGAAVEIQFWNNLTVGGQLRFGAVTLASAVFDNLFDRTAVGWADAGTPPNGFNGYVATDPLAGGANNVVMASFQYALGPYGEFYQSSRELVDAGSRAAAAAGLALATTRPDDTPEGDSTVDIGFHYPISVTPTRYPPYIGPIADQTVDEMAPLAVPIPAVDTNTPPQPLVLSVLAGPVGMQISNGTLWWTPSEAQGPGTHPVTVVARNSLQSSLSATQSFVIVVREVNRPPSLSVPPDQQVAAAVPWTQANYASDPDIPANHLTFRLVSGPAGVVLDAETGLMTWTPGADQANATYPITIAVTDDGVPSLGATQSFRVTVLAPASPYTLVSLTEQQRGPNTRQWQTVMRYATAGGQLALATNRYVEQRAGWHYLSNGSWVESAEEIAVSAGGDGWAVNGQHQVFFPTQIGLGDQVQITMADSQVLRGHPVALAYYDAGSGRSVSLGTNAVSSMSLAAPNQAVYRSAFENIAADVKYTYMRAGLEQDVILRQNPPAPAVFGLDPRTTRLEVWTEFTSAPTPARHLRVLKATPATSAGQVAIEPQWIDEQLDFGPMMMVSGRAFALGDTNASPALVVKRWLHVAGHDYLIEGVAYAAISNALAALPPSSSMAPGVLPARPPYGADEAVGRNGGALPELMMAAAGRGASGPGAGVVIDFLLVNQQTNFTYQGDQTYLLSGPVYLGRQTIFEGGAVIKYERGAKIHLAGPATCLTDPYRPLVFTAKDDDTVGAVLPGSSGSPAGYYAEPALALEGSNVIAQAQFRRAKTALALLGGGGYTLQHAQVDQCETALEASLAEVVVRNALVVQARTVFQGAGSTVRGEQLTVDGAAGLNGGPDLALFLTNSLVASVVSLGPMAGQNAVELGLDSGIFQAAGGGAHYLPADSRYRNAGTAAIDGDLARDLRELTTEAPLLLDDEITEPTVYAPLVARDRDTPDLGYHYAPLDYVWRSVRAGAALQWGPGVAMGVLGSGGLVLAEGAELRSQGYPQALNQLVRCSAVQEQTPLADVPSLGQAGLIEVVAGTPVPIRLRFTAVSVNGGGAGLRALLGGGGGGADFSLMDCPVDNLTLGMGSADSRLSLTNNCLRRCEVIAGDAGNPIGVTMYNNLFYRSAVLWGLLSPDSLVFDNVFDHSAISGSGVFNHGFNAYVETPPLAGGAGEITLAGLDYLPGPLGDFYTADASLLDAGSRSAREAGLYHYTTSTNEQKELDTRVDIGWHYPATRYQFDSATDFTAVQGLNQWYEQFADLGGAPVGYLPDYLEANRWWWGSGDEYCIVGQAMQHPGDAYDAVRTFVAPYDGEVRVASTAAKAWTQGPSDGVNVRVMKNAETLLDWQTLTDPNAGFSTVLNAAVKRGDSLYFQVNRNAGNGNDTTLWHVGIEYTNPEAKRMPWDADGDGVPDYLEDANGNGITDAGETSFLLADSAGDGLSDFRRYTAGTLGVSPTSGQKVRLGHWSFNDAELASDDGDKPLIARNLARQASFEGSGVFFTSAANRPMLRYRERQAGLGGYNFAVSNSTMRFYYQPAWTSKADQGQGPGAEACLLALGDPDSPNGGYALTIDPEGNNLKIVMSDGRRPKLFLSGSIHFFSNTWYQLSWNLSSKPLGAANALRVTVFDTVLIDYVSNEPLPLPSAAARLNGLSVGSRGDGTQPALGGFDELDTFNYDVGEIGRHLNNIALAAAVTVQPPGIKLTWVRGPNSPLTVQRRSAGETNWTSLGAGSGWSYTDRDSSLLAGQRYDYQLLPAGVVAGNNEITVGLALPPVHYRGKVLVLVDTSLAAAIADNLSVYLDDLRGDGWQVSRYDVPRHNDAAWVQTATNANYIQDVAAIKSLIQREYAAAPGELKSVVLLGHVTIPYAGNTAEDGHISLPGDPINHQGAWPADVYYGDVDGVWTDSAVSYTNTYNPVLQNLPGDGKWDANAMVSPLELAVGRIDFANLPSFASPPLFVAPRQEKDLLNQYLAKDHRYRQGQLALPAQGMAVGYYAGIVANENALLYDNATLNLSRWFGFSSWPFVQGDCFVTPTPMVWGFQVGFGNASSINSGTANQHTTQTLADPAQEPRVGFYMVGGSFMADWNFAPDSFMRALLATPRYGLAAVWMRYGTWRFEGLGLGETLGDGLVKTANDARQGRSCRTTFLLGDPTLRLNILAPPRNLTASRDLRGAVKLGWRASLDPAVKYFVYRAPAQNGSPRYDLLTPEPVASTTYTDPAATSGPITYQVRAVALTVSGCGSYTNLSQAIQANTP